jgi:hypothetical protein
MHPWGPKYTLLHGEWGRRRGKGGVGGARWGVCVCGGGAAAAADCYLMIDSRGWVWAKVKCQQTWELCLLHGPLWPPLCHQLLRW